VRCQAQHALYQASFNWLSVCALLWLLAQIVMLKHQSNNQSREMEDIQLRLKEARSDVRTLTRQSILISSLKSVY